MKTFILKKTFLTLFALLVAGSLFAKPKAKGKAKVEKKVEIPGAPNWVTDPTTAYSEEKYFLKVGEGKSKSTALINAINGVGSVFSQGIKNTAFATRRLAQAMKEGQIAAVDTSSFTQDIVKKVSIDNLIGVELKDTWCYEENGTWYALATINKARTASLYDGMIKKNNGVVKKILSVKNNKTQLYTFETYAKFDFAKDIALKNEGYLARLSLLDGLKADEIRDDVVTKDTMVAESLEVSQGIVVGVSVADDIDARFAGAFKQVCTDSLFRASDNPKERYTIKATVTFESAPTKDKKAINCEWVVSALLRDNIGGRDILPFDFKGKLEGSSEADAKQKAMKAAKDAISKDGIKVFKDYLTKIAVW